MTDVFIGNFRPNFSLPRYVSDHLIRPLDNLTSQLAARKIHPRILTVIIVLLIYMILYVTYIYGTIYIYILFSLQIVQKWIYYKYLLFNRVWLIQNFWKVYIKYYYYISKYSRFIIIILRGGFFFIPFPYKRILTRILTRGSD